MKNANNGEILFPPMFDFNLAHINQENYFLSTVADCIREDGYKREAIEILMSWADVGNNVWENNKQRLIEILKK